MTDRFNADILLNYAVSDDGQKTTLVLGGGASAPQMTLTMSPDLLERLMLTLPVILVEIRERREQVEIALYPMRWRSSIFRSRGNRRLAF